MRSERIIRVEELSQSQISLDVILSIPYGCFQESNCQENQSQWENFVALLLARNIISEDFDNTHTHIVRHTVCIELHGICENIQLAVKHHLTICASKSILLFICFLLRAHNQCELKCIEKKSRSSGKK